VAEAPTGTDQLEIRAIAFARELAEYLAGQMADVTYGTNMFIARMPASPVRSNVIVPDPTPFDRTGAMSRLHFTIQCRDTHIETSGARASVIWELLTKKGPPLPSYHAFFTPDRGPDDTYFFNTNNHPVHSLGFTALGVVKRA